MKQNPENIAKFILTNRSRFLSGIILVLLRSVAVLPFPWFIRTIIDEYVPSGNKEGILTMIILSVGCLLMHYAFSVSGANSIATGISGAICQIRSKLFSKIQFLSFAYLDKESTGRILSKYAIDTRKIQDTMMMILNQSIPNIFLSFSIYAILLIMDWRLSITIVLMLPVVWIMKNYFHKIMQQEHRKVRVAHESLTGNANELISALRLFRSLGEEEKAEHKIESHNYNFGESLIHLTGASSRFGTFIYVATNLIQIIIVGGGAILVLNGYITLGTLFAFVIALPQILMPLNIFAQLSENYFAGQESYSSVCEILDCDYVENWKGKNKLATMRGDIKFENVSFYYPSKPDNLVLNHFSLHIRPGEHVALVGSSGSGKSTVANLILGLYDITGGTIRIDDEAHRSLDMRDFRQRCAIVMQDNLILSGSVMDNLKIAKADATPEEIKEAARAANAEEFIMQLTEGYDTQLGERGVSLSGGQRQRISIARAILRNPKILILDEATSALDNESERLIQEALDLLANGRTVISIAHRLSTIRNADRIVVMGTGEILEQGTFAELANNGTHFKKLLQTQIEMTEKIQNFQEKAKEIETTKSVKHS
jgi:ABC-type multidrug transport system fused ATPase/permease subunit